MNNELFIDELNKAAEWTIGSVGTSERVLTPWAQMWLGDDRGEGLEVWVEATHEFDLVVHWAGVSYSEHIQPGKTRLLLSYLDRTEVVRIE